jgi:hypothetical protein
MILHGTRGTLLRQAQNCLRSPHSPFQSTLSRFLSSLAILEQRDGKLQNASLSAVTAAQKLGGSITGFIAGSGVKSVAEEAAKVNGLDKIIMIENGAYDKVGPSPAGHIRFPHDLTISHRVFRKIMPLCLLRTLRKEDLHMSWLGTRPLART